MSLWDTILSYGPSVLWKMNEGAGVTADDATANNRDGTYVNTPTLGEPSIIPATSETSVRLTRAQSEKVERAYEVWMDGVTFTMGIWFKAPSVLVDMELMGHVDCLQIWLRATGEIYYYSFNGGWQLMTAPAGSIAANGTYLICVSNGAAGRNIIVRDVVKATSATRQNPRSLNNPFAVGRSSIGPSYLDGWVQGFFWIPSQLTVAQIQDLWTQSQVPITAPSQPGTFTNPVFGDYVSGIVALNWGDSVNVDSYTLEKYYGGVWTEIANGIVGSGYNWNTSGLAGGAYKLRVKAVKAGEADSSYRESDTFLVNSGTGPLIWASILAHSPALLWKLNELTGSVAQDSSGNSRGGDLINTPTLGEPSLIPNAPLDNSMRFTAASLEMVQRAHEAWMNGDTFTVGVWMKAATLASMSLWQKGDRVQCWLRDDGKVWFYEFDSDWRLIESSVASWAVGDVVMVVITNSATARRIIVNGVQRGAGSGSNPHDSATEPLQLAHANSGYFDGHLQGYFWIPAELSVADVLEIYEQGQTAPVPPGVPGAFTSPLAGDEYVAEDVPVAWGISDDDSATYDLEYSRDGGATRHPVASGIVGTEYTWSPTTRAGTYVLYVRANNSFGSSDWTESDPFTITPLLAGFNKLEAGTLFDDPHNAPGLDPDSDSWATDEPPNPGRWDAEGPLQERWREGFGFDIETDDGTPVLPRKPKVVMTIQNVRYMTNIKTPCPRAVDCEWTVVMEPNQYLVIEVWRQYDATDPLLPAGEGDPVLEGYLLQYFGDEPNVTVAATGTATFPLYHTKTVPGGVNMNIWLKGKVYNDVVVESPVRFSEDDTVAREVDSEPYLLSQFAPCGGWT